MKIFWYPTYFCNNYNQSCTYCNEKKVFKDYYKKNLNQKKATPNKIINFFNSVSDYEIHITGGEPTIESLLLAEVLNNVSNRWIMNSNTQLTKNIFHLILKTIKNKCFLWNASFHPENKDWNIFKNNLKFLNSYNIPININYVCCPQNIKCLFEHLSFLDTLCLTKTTIIVIQEINTILSQNISFKTLLEYNVKILKPKIKTPIILTQIPVIHNSGQIKKCQLYNFSISLDEFGKIYPCVETLLNSSQSLGNIKDLDLLYQKLESPKTFPCVLDCWRFHCLEKFKCFQ